MGVWWNYVYGINTRNIWLSWDSREGEGTEGFMVLTYTVRPSISQANSGK